MLKSYERCLAWLREQAAGDACWVWPWASSVGGPRFKQGGKGQPVAPVAFYDLRGAPRTGRPLVRTCDEPRCVNPAHRRERAAVRMNSVDRLHGIARRHAPDACWLWDGKREVQGYGVGYHEKRVVKAHRLSFLLLRGAIPDGMELDHLCRNRACVNPAHLEPVRHVENVLRGVSPTAVNAGKSQCERGHPLDEENVIARAGGGRSCRACLREVYYPKRNQRRREKRRQRVSHGQPIAR
jgi:hypothetical protein